MNTKFSNKKLLIIIPTLILSAVLTAVTMAAHDSVPNSSAEDCEQFRAELLLRIPDFAKFGKCRKNRVELLNKNSEFIGVLLLAPAGKYQRKEGFDGFINTAVLLDKNNKVAGVILGKNSETPAGYNDCVKPVSWINGMAKLFRRLLNLKLMP